jgi:NDP-hexose 4-ketoreductase
MAGFTGTIREEAAAPSRSSAVDWMRGDISLARTAVGSTPAFTLAESIKAIWAGASTS